MQYITLAIKQSAKIIFTPEMIRKNIEKRIHAVSSQHQDELMKLLILSYDSKMQHSFDNYCLKIYGGLYNDIKFFSTDTKSAIINHGKTINVDNLIGIMNDNLKHISENMEINQAFGHMNLSDFSVETSASTGYAEWWDKDLTQADKDKLILFVNSDSMYINDFVYTIYHEIYPGHGHVYNLLAHNKQLFDHGAMSLIEGWATYCEWNIIPSEYIKSIKRNACTFLNYTFNYSGDNLAEQIYHQKTTIGYSKEEILRTVLYTSQYIGFLESYYIGALWLEFYFDKNKIKPIEFLKMLKKRNVGEFFSLW